MLDVSAESDPEAVQVVFKEAGAVAGCFHFTEAPAPVLFVRRHDSVQIDQFCTQRTAPFYERSWGEKLNQFAAGDLVLN